MTDMNNIANQQVSLDNEVNNRLINRLNSTSNKINYNLFEYHPFCQNLLNNYKTNRCSDMGYFSNFIDHFQQIITQFIVDCKKYGNKHTAVRYHHMVRPKVTKITRGKKEEEKSVCYKLTYTLPSNARNDFLESISVCGLNPEEIDTAELELKDNASNIKSKFLLKFKAHSNELVLAKMDRNQENDNDLRPMFIPCSIEDCSATVTIHVNQYEYWDWYMKRNFSLVCNYLYVDTGVFGYIVNIQTNLIDVMTWEEYVCKCKEEEKKRRIQSDEDIKSGRVLKLSPWATY